jgi:hypothetical protein
MVEHFVKSKLKSWSGTKLTAADTYATVTDAVTSTAYFIVRGFKSKVIQLSAATNALQYSIDVSNDGSIWINKVTDQALAVATPVGVVLNEIWDFLRVQVKPAAAGVHGTITVKIVGGTL